MTVTDFEFGYNDPSNADPWGQNTEPEHQTSRGNKTRADIGEATYDTEVGADSGPVSEDWLPEETVEYVRKQIKLMTETVRKANRMLPKAGQSERAKPQGGKGNRIPFLTNEHLSKQPKEAKILSVRAVEKNWNGNTTKAVSYKLAMDGHTFMWDLKLTNPNLATLQDKFGLDENDHVGQKILIYLEQDEHTEQFWPRVDFPKSTPAKTAR